MIKYDIIILYSLRKAVVPLHPAWFFLVGIPIVLLFVTLIANSSDSSPRESLRYPKLQDGVIFFSHECGDITWQENKQLRRIPLSPNKAIEHRALQRKVKEYISHTPIHTDVRITNYAWDLTDALNLANLLPEMWDPVAAYHFCNGVVMVRYMERPPENGTRGTAVKDLYFATSDGHLIYFKS